MRVRRGRHTTRGICVSWFMRRLLFTALMLSAFASGVKAQWLVPENAWMNGGESDRPHSTHRKRIHPLSVPPGIANWPFPNIDVTNDPDNDQTEPSIQINPLDSNYIVIGANDDRTFNTLWAYSSKDGGHTWQNQPLPLVLIDSDADVIATDPSIAFSSDGKVYFGNGHLGLAGVPDDVACFESSNTGQAWSITSGYPYLNPSTSNDTSTDKYFITVDADPSSPFHDRVYATWVEIVGSTPPRIAFSYSSDGGMTWSARVFLTSQGYYSAPVPATAPDGSIVVIFEQYTLGATYILESRSTNGSISFSGPKIIQHYIDVGPWRGDSATNDGHPVVKDTVRANSFP